MTVESKELTKEEFENMWCNNSGFSIDFYKCNYVTLPCDCKEELCLGWAAISNEKHLIDHHLQSNSEISAYRDQLLNIALKKDLSERQEVQVYVDELIDLVNEKELLEAQNNGWSTIIYEFIQRYNLFHEFATHLKELKEIQESNKNVYYGDLDFILLDYLPEGNEKNQ